MVHSNKVLTVSYGTFSCTLEGFEDSFDTMKAIAEYFRDLAADDRYFGAEPPQPDTEMLARIAEREIARQVEARREGSGFVLRAAQPEQTAALAGAASEAPAPTEEEERPAEAAEEPAEVGTDAAPEPEIPESAAAETPAEPEQAQPAERERAETATTEEAAAVTEQAEEEATEAAAPAPEDAAEPVETAETEEAPLEVAEEAAAAFMAGAEARMPEQDEYEEDLAPEADIGPETFEAEPVEPETAPAPAPAADSIAAKLQRIRAVVSRNERATVEVDYTEDEHSEDAFFAAAVTGAEDETAEAEPTAQDGMDTADREDEQARAAAPAPADEAAVDEGEDMMNARRAARLRRRQARAQKAAEDEKAAEKEAALHAGAATAETEEDDGALFADLDAEPHAEAADSDAEDNILSDRDARARAAAMERRRARVVMVKRDEDATEDQAAEREEEGEARVVPSVDLPPSTLAPEEEAELMRELAEVEAELRGEAGAEPAEETPDQPEEEQAADHPAAETEEDRPEPRAARRPAEENSDLSRLMAAADEKLDAPEAATTRETYSHLRAAVAATQAERSAGGDVSQHPDAEAYRADLAHAVRPRRPKPGPGRRARPDAAEQTRPAPLKLVAEQRVDDIAEKAAKSGSVRPRRVAAPVEEPKPAASDESFAAFAEEMGAQDLHEILEAAAAYMQFVEGREQFTRPQLIHKAREATAGEFSREDGLRSFGMLLREGKIAKQDSGRFVATGEIGFQPASRAAG